jgi:hypothetical protein
VKWRQRRAVAAATAEVMVIFVIMNLLASQWRIAVVAARRQFGNPQEGECPPLEAVTIRLVKAQKAHKT